ncbi:MAG TPA: hypothetical protein VH835_13405 [Dongiaceae bacterium]
MPWSRYGEICQFQSAFSSVSPDPLELVAAAVAEALPQGPLTDLCESFVTMPPLAVLVLLADAEAVTLQLPLPLTTVASVSAAAHFSGAELDAAAP